MYQGLERKKENANYLVCSVLNDPSFDQRLEFIKQENILKLKIKLIGWFIYDKVQRQSTVFPHITLIKRTYLFTLVNNKARVSVVSDKCVLLSFSLSILLSLYLQHQATEEGN